jgi:hypothetical protein
MNLLRLPAGRALVLSGRTAVLAAGAAVLLAGCASDQGAAAPTATTSVATSASGGSMTPVPSSPSAPPPGVPPSAGGGPGGSGQPGGEVTLTGEVDLVEIEGGCLVLHAGTQTFELAGGDRDELRPGTTVRVRGRLRPDLLTACQVGPVLEVLDVQPA